MACVGMPFVACIVPDFFTFMMGKFMVKSEFLSLPNAIFGCGVTPEFIIRHKLNDRMAESIVDALFQQDLGTVEEIASRLRKSLNVGQTSSELMSEFLAQLVKS